MKKSILIVIMFIGLFFTEKQLFAQELNPNYDADLALKLGADEYGMKSFVLVVLKTGANKSTNAEVRSDAFAGHLKNINRLVEDNKLIVAGPFGQNESDFRGLFILDAKTLDEANKLLQTDPAITAGYLKAELYKWYGSAALSTYLEASDKVWQRKP